MADFIFRVESVKLTDAQQEKIAAAIQGAVLTELAKLDLGGGQPKSKSSADFLYRPITWRGGIMIPVDGVREAAGTVLTATTKSAT